MGRKSSFLEGLVNILFNNIYKNKTVLITGDTGFKGSWLAIWLTELGANVIGYAFEPKTDKDNYVVCGLQERMKHINGDIRDFDSLKQVFDEYNPEIVFHLAAQALVLEGYNDPVETFDTNIMGTVNILESIRHSPSVQAAVMITTDKCYENKEWMYGYRENDRLGGKDPYSASKAAAEIVINSYVESFFKRNETANIASVRAGNVIGGGDWSTHRIVPDCIRSLQQGEAISIRNPSAVRPWQHVLEPLSGYLNLGAALMTKGKIFSEPWNFGPFTNDVHAVKELVEEIVGQWGAGEIVLAKEPNQHHEASLLQLDITKAVNRLGWKPQFSFKDAVELTVEEYKIERLTVDQIYEQRVKQIETYMQKWSE